MPSKLALASGETRRDLAEISIALVAGLALVFTALLLCVIPFSGDLAGSRDFVAYWATGQQLVHHADPYDHDALQKIEHNAGLSPNGTLIMRNPPWALPLVFPLGWMGPRLASTFWTLLLLACLVISLLIIRALHGSPPNLIYWLGLGFSPALMCLIMGQTSLFSLLGFALFLRYHSTRPFVAGLSLWLCALKPQLFLPFSVALLAWIVVSRSYRIVAGTAVAVAISSAAATLIDPTVWADYSRLMRSPSVQQEYVPCPSDALRFWIDPHAIWLQYVPAALCCVWALIYFWKNRHNWNWTTNSSPLMLASLLTAPYSWFYDQTLAIPAMMHGAYVTRSRWLLVVLAAIIALVDVEMCAVKVISSIYIWNIPVWFAWYLLATTPAHRKAVPLVEAVV
jgi:hypothetical protein